MSFLFFEMVAKDIAQVNAGQILELNLMLGRWMFLGIL